MRKELDKEPDKDERVARRIQTGEERQRLLRAAKKLIAAGEVSRIQPFSDEIRKKWLLAVPEKKAGRKPIKPRFDC